MLRVDDLKECLVALESTTEKRDNSGENGTESVGLQGPMREKLSRVIVESISGRVTASFAPVSFYLSAAIRLYRLYLLKQRTL